MVNSFIFEKMSFAATTPQKGLHMNMPVTKKNLHQLRKKSILLGIFL